MYDLRNVQHAGAIFAPACQEAYTRFVGLHSQEPLRPAGLVKHALDYFSPETRLCRLRTVLVSAFYRRRHNYRCMIEERDRALGSIVLMDSGGYSSINTEFVPDRSYAHLTFRRQEREADLAMTLDAPTQAIDRGVNRALDTFDKCLELTKTHLKLYAQLRRSKIPVILNVLQGRTEAECQRWYDEVKQFPFEGWAFAGNPQHKFSLVLRRIIRMLDDKKLDACPWIHFLGTGRLDAAVVLTAICDALRSVLCRDDIQVSYDDAASSVNAHARTSGHVSANLGKRGFSWEVARLPDSQHYVGQPDPYPLASSPIARRLTYGDICVKKAAGTSWDNQSGCLIENHVTYTRVQALGEVARRSKLLSPDALELVPKHLVAIREVVIAAISKGSLELVDKWAAQLDHPERPVGKFILDWENYGLR